MNDDLQIQRVAAEHARCWQLIPWYINGTLSADEASGAEQHFASCPECAKELEQHRGLQTQLRDGDPVLMGPQSAWQKMAERLDSEDEALARGHFRLGSKGNVAWRWAVAAQALLIVGLTTVVWQQSRAPDSPGSIDMPTDAMLQPSYVTLTASSEAVTDGAVRVVFRHDVSLADVNALLRELSTQIVAGPSEASVYTLALPNFVTASSGVEQTAAMLKVLRGDARVVFAEPAEHR
jgi:anti-sigma factor RsiW